MSGLNPRLFPSPLSLFDALQRTPAHTRTEALQGTSPLSHKSLVAAWPVTAMLEKNVL
jgi:hypothetical protein